MSKRRQPYWAHSNPLPALRDSDVDDRPDVVDRLCPTPACNRAYLRAAHEAHVEHHDGDSWTIVDGIKPTGGAPFWCDACQERIRKAIGRLPDLAASVHVIGSDPPHVLRRVVDRGRTVTFGRLDTAPQATGVPTVVGEAVQFVDPPDWWWDRLDCGHVIHYPAPRTAAQVRTLPSIRRCGACLTGAGRDTGSSQIGAGRVAASSADTDRTRHGTRTGSPSGSPALDMVDYVAAWAADWVDELAEHLAHATRSAKGVRPRMTHLSEHASYLTTHLSAVLASEAMAVRVGTEVLDLVRLLERAAGEDRLRHRLPAPCPACDRRALVRDDGSEQVDCLACHTSWPEADYRRLTLILASDLQEEQA